MKREICLFDGRKTLAIDKELLNCFELYVQPLTKTRLDYLTLVFELSEDMTEDELIQRFSEALYEEINMSTVMEEDFIAAMRKMSAENLSEVKLDEVRAENKKSDKWKVDKEGIYITIRAKQDMDISQERIERCLACLYKSIRYSKNYIVLDKKLEDDIVKEIELLVEENRVLELMELVERFETVIFEGANGGKRGAYLKVCINTE